jgi:hypothetical protein
MKRLTKGILIFTSAVVLMGIVAMSIPVVHFILAMKSIGDQANRGREHLFYETDYSELVAGCRELSRRVAEESLKPKQYQVFFFDSDPDPNALTFPQVILDLEPMIVCVDRDGLGDVELLSGPEYFGVRAFPEGREGWGQVKLVDGLWYYDSDYRDEYPKYMKKIDAMIEEGRRRKAARAATQPAPPSGEETAR